MLEANALRDSRCVFSIVDVWGGFFLSLRGVDSAQFATRMFGAVWLQKRLWKVLSLRFKLSCSWCCILIYISLFGSRQECLPFDQAVVPQPQRRQKVSSGSEQAGGQVPKCRVGWRSSCPKCRTASEFLTTEAAQGYRPRRRQEGVVDVHVQENAVRPLVFLFSRSLSLSQFFRFVCVFFFCAEMVARLQVAR